MIEFGRSKSPRPQIAWEPVEVERSGKGQRFIEVAPCASGRKRNDVLEGTSAKEINSQDLEKTWLTRMSQHCRQEAEASGVSKRPREHIRCREEALMLHKMLLLRLILPTLGVAWLKRLGFEFI